MWLAADRNPGYTATFTILLDGVECGHTTVVNTGYTKIGMQLQVSGNSHQVKVVIASTGADEASAIFSVDDVSVTPVSGPGFIDTCAVASPSSSVSPSVPSVTSLAIPK
jgi:hypothetical protein